MIKVALAPISDWTAAAGIEKVPAGSPIAARLARTTGFTDEFGDASFDGTLFGSQTANGGSLTEAGGVLEIDTSGGNTEQAFFWPLTAIDPAKTFSIVMKFRYTNVLTDVGTIFHVQQEADPSTPDIANRCIAFYYHNVGPKFYASYWDSGNTRRWFSVAASVGWTTSNSEDILRPTQNTWYILKFKGDGTNWWYEIWDADDTTCLVSVDKVAWAGTRAPGGSYYFIAGNYFTSNGLTVLEFDSFTYEADDYDTGSPTIESPWMAVDHDQIDGIEINENALASTIGYSAGTVKYQYALNGGAYNGSWLTLAALKSALSGEAVTDHTNSLRIQAQLNSDGSTNPDIVLAGEIEASGFAFSATFNQPLEVLELITEREVIER